jgi:hypothetical protein
VNFKLIQKHYRGTIPRPNIEVSLRESENLIVLTSSWGMSEGGVVAAETIANYFSLAMTDKEATSPFAKLPSLSHHANSLRIATMLANDSVYDKFNRQEYTSGCELSAINLNNGELNWVQFGQPHLLIARENQLHLIQSAHDLSFQFKSKSALPEKLLGIERQVELQTNSIKLEKKDKLVILVRTTVPRACYAKNFQTQNSESLCQQIYDFSIEEDNDLALWVGILDLI